MRLLASQAATGLLHGKTAPYPHNATRVTTRQRG